MSDFATTIAIVEDDEVLLYGLSEMLGSHGYKVTGIGDGQEALEVLGREVPDLLILDLMLPKVHGLEVCRHLRARYPWLPILILSAKGKEADKVEGLKTGADDYLTKPFSSAELLARIEALLRRLDRREKIRFGPNEIDLSERRVFRCGKEVALTAIEFRLLRLLLRASGGVLSRDAIVAGVWGYGAYPDARTVDYHVRGLRKKLEDDPENPVYFQSVRSVGYVFDHP